MPTALIVEDEPEANRLLSLLIRMRGYDTTSAFNGQEALASIRQSPPDVVFLDLMLPDIDGFEICKALKDHRPTSGIPVVMVTARVAAENRLQGFRAGASEYVPKPYTPDQIFEALGVADRWKRALEDNPWAGEIEVGTGDDAPTIDRITQLHSFLLARTRCDEAAIHRIRQALLELCQNLSAWGRRNGKDQVATIRYEIAGDSLNITLVDRSEVLGPGGLSPEESWQLLSNRTATEREPGAILVAVSLSQRWVSDPATPSKSTEDL